MKNGKKSHHESICRKPFMLQQYKRHIYSPLESCDCLITPSKRRTLLPSKGIVCVMHKFIFVENRRTINCLLICLSFNYDSVVLFNVSIVEKCVRDLLWLQNSSLGHRIHHNGANINTHSMYRRIFLLDLCSAIFDLPPRNSNKRGKNRKLN